jgi:hypothetical protein
LALARNGSTLVAGGIADARGRALARFDPRTLRPRSWPGAPRILQSRRQPGGIDQLAAARGRLYLFGAFTTVGGRPRASRLAAITAGGRVLPFAPRLGRNVVAEHLAACPGFVAVSARRAASDDGEDNVDFLLDPSSGRALRWAPHPALAGPIYVGPGGLVADTVAGGVSLFPGSLGGCSPS